MNTQQQQDEILWQAAKRRAAFKASFSAYLLVNAALVAIWYLTTGTGSYCWPIWPILGWGLGIAGQYAGAYHAHQLFSAEEEYKKLKQQQDGHTFSN